MTGAARRPDVAVLVPAWRAESVLARAVDSALAQEGVAVEVAVVDDCSPDGTFAAAEALAARDPRVVALRQSRNQGPSAARNAAIAATTAPWVCPLDSDDFMEPGRLARMLAAAEADALDLLADDLLQVRESALDGPRRRLWSETPIGALDISLEAFVLGNLSERRGGRRELGFIKPLMRRAFLERHRLAYDEGMRLGEDYDLYARALAAGGRLRLIDPCGYVGVLREGSLSSSHGASELGHLVGADQRLLQLDLSRAERAAVRAHLTETQKRWRWVRLIDAVKARDPLEAARCFAASPAVIAALLANLTEQAVLRGARLIGVRS